MLAAFDISNTRLTLGLFEGERLAASFSLAADVHRTPDEYAILLAAFLRDAEIPRKAVHGGAVASVVPPLTETIQQVCGRLFGLKPRVVGVGTRTGIRVATLNPRELGPDRVVNAIAARHLYGAPVVVVDLDTATTVDVIAADGSYAGCAIAPGLALSAEALFHGTSLLQRVEIERPRSVIGRDTISSLQAGLLFGHVALVEGLVQRVRAEAGSTGPVVATGDLAPLVAAETQAIDRIDPWLSLTGLRLFYQLNENAA